MKNKTLRSLSMLCTWVTATAVHAQMPLPVPVAAPQEPAGAIALYGETVGNKSTEQWVKFNDDYVVRNVTRPTLTPFLPPAGKATGAAVIVAPGGGFNILAISLEGWQVARALADHGIAAFVLKYRIKETPVDDKAFIEFTGKFMEQIARSAKEGKAPPIQEPRATEDALAALKLVRSRATEWGIDPTRIGMMGFSAGAMTTLNAGLAKNPADRPAFIAPIYGPMLPLDVPADAPPMFSAFALDDELFSGQGFGLIERWHAAGRPVELHAYERGGHGFGLGRPGTSSSLMLEEFITWLQSRGTVPGSHP